MFADLQPGDTFTPRLNKTRGYANVRLQQRPPPTTSSVLFSSQCMLQSKTDWQVYFPRNYNYFIRTLPTCQHYVLFLSQEADWSIDFATKKKEKHNRFYISNTQKVSFLELWIIFHWLILDFHIQRLWLLESMQLSVSVLNACVG